MRHHSYENDFDLHENETACRTHFHMKGFALRLVLKQRHMRTRKWPIKHEQNIIGSKTRLDGTTHEQTITCTQLVAGLLVASRPMGSTKKCIE